MTNGSRFGHKARIHEVSLGSFDFATDNVQGNVINSLLRRLGCTRVKGRAEDRPPRAGRRVEVHRPVLRSSAGGDFATGGIWGIVSVADSREDKESILKGIQWYKNTHFH